MFNVQTCSNQPEEMMYSNGSNILSISKKKKLIKWVFGHLTVQHTVYPGYLNSLDCKKNKTILA